MKTDKKSPPVLKGGSLKNSWTLDNAMYVLKHPTVDSKIWADAVEWLLLYGPKDIQEMLLSASENATKNCFPELEVIGYSTDGEPIYNVDDLARALGITPEEAQDILERKLKSHENHSKLSTKGPAKIQ